MSNHIDPSARRRERLIRTRTIRRRVIGGAVALFVAAWLMIAVVLVSGHDPALASRNSTTGTAASTQTTTGTAASTQTTTTQAAAQTDDQSQSSQSSQSSGSGSIVTRSS